MPTESFCELLKRWSAGDRAALATILAEELPWIRSLVHKRLGEVLRRGGDTHDYAQEVVVDVLTDGPKFVVSDRSKFRALIARIVENTLRDSHERFTAQCRDVRRELRAETGFVALDALARSATGPTDAASREETSGWIRLALELLDPDDRRVILLRGYEELPFKEVAERLEISVKATQMRFARALRRLGQRVEDLRNGKLAEFLGR